MWLGTSTNVWYSSHMKLWCTSEIIITIPYKAKVHEWRTWFIKLCSSFSSTKSPIPFGEILTLDSRNSKLTELITRSDRTHLNKLDGTNNMTHMIKSNQTKHAQAQPVPPNHVSTADTHASTDITRRLVTKTRVTANPPSSIRARTHIRSDTQQTHTQNVPLWQ